jgi:poly-gamma-glutamate synthesis protein (capsule biosynthesis protein)
MLTLDNTAQDGLVAAGSLQMRPRSHDGGLVTVFLCGDVMTGRGIDQIMRHPGAPLLHERAVEDAREYVELAEARNGPIPRGVDASYIWGDALEELERVKPGARIVNLETSITRSDDFCPDKEVHYRMHPENVGCLTAAGIDVCALANNHVLDWGVEGLLETTATLAKSGIATAGAGGNIGEAGQPASVERGNGTRLLAFALGSETSGIPPSWAAAEQGPGVDLLEDLSPAAASRVARRLRERKRPGDVAIASIHWGTNWGYDVSPSFVHFAHRLADAGFDIVHGHSSHHVRPIEVYRDRLILYGCGDFIDDYEGIAGYEAFRDDLALMYFATLDAASGELEELRMVPMQIRNFRLARPSRADIEWLRETVAGCSAPFGSSIELGADGSLLLRWRPC